MSTEAGFGSPKRPERGPKPPVVLHGSVVADLPPRPRLATGTPLDMTARRDGPTSIDPLAFATLHRDARAAEKAVSQRRGVDRLLVTIEFDGAGYQDLRGDRGVSLEKLRRGDRQAWRLIAASREAGADVISIRAEDNATNYERAGRVEIVFIGVFDDAAHVTSQTLWSSSMNRVGKHTMDRGRRRNYVRRRHLRWSAQRIAMFGLWQGCVTLGTTDQLVSLLSSQVSVPLVALVGPAVLLSLVLGWFGAIKLLDLRDWAIYRWRTAREQRERRRAQALMLALLDVSEKPPPAGGRGSDPVPDPGAR